MHGVGVAVSTRAFILLSRLKLLICCAMPQRRRPKPHQFLCGGSVTSPRPGSGCDLTVPEDAFLWSAWSLPECGQQLAVPRLRGYFGFNNLHVCPVWHAICISG